MPVLGDADGLAVVVILRSQEDAENSARYVALALDGNGVFVRFMIQPLELCLNVRLRGLLLMQLFHVVGGSLVEIDIVVVEEGHKRRDLDVLDADAVQQNVVVLVSGQRFLVTVEQVDDLLVELVEGWVTNGDLSQLEDGGRVVVDVVHFGSIAEELASDGLEAAVVSVIGIDTSLYKFGRIDNEIRLSLL